MVRDSNAECLAPPDSEVFCMLPWVGLHVAMNGDVLPCCAAADAPFGSVRTQTLREAWNSENARALRRSMLAGRKSALCARCYEQDESGFSSLRAVANEKFGHHGRAVRDTSPDGAVPQPAFVYLDIRFSNICNFACRTCGPAASTGWWKYEKMDDGPLVRPRPSVDSLLEEINPFLDQIEQVYFAGGEPAITREHYLFLEMLLAHGRDDVELSYSTNYSFLEWKQWDLLELWKSFRHVNVGASLDGSHRRGEYLRKGQSWDKVVDNRRRHLDVCPHVSFNITSTLSLLNSLHAPDFHEEWVELGLIEPGQIHINILQEPSYFRLTTLPAALKSEVEKRYERHLQFLAKHPNCEGAIRGYESAVRFMYSEDTSGELDSFRTVIGEQDRLRGESFASTFPELAQAIART